MHNGVEVIRTRRCSADGAAVVDTRIFDLTSTLIQRLERNRKISLFNPRVKFALRIMKFEAQCDPPILGLASHSLLLCITAGCSSKLLGAY